MPMKTFLHEYGMALLSMMMCIFLTVTASPISTQIQGAMTDVVNQATDVANFDDLEIISDGSIGSYNGKKVIKSDVSCSKSASNEDLSSQKSLFTVTLTYKDNKSEKVPTDKFTVKKTSENEDKTTYNIKVEGEKVFDAGNIDIVKITPIFAGYNSNDTTLYFAKTAKELEDVGVTINYRNISTVSFVNSNSAPWHSLKSNITKVNFLSEIKPTSCGYWFYQFENLTEIDNIKNLNTSNVTSMSNMFAFCNKLTSLDLSNFDRSKVTDMSSMFAYCSKLTSLDLSNFDTSKVTSMRYMFGYCSSLTSLDLSNFDTSKVTDMSNMFAYCSKLTSLDLSNFDTSKVTSMSDMFAYCSKLTSLDLSNFDTSKVPYMSYMFHNCSSLTTLKLGSFNPTKVANYLDIFRGMNTNATIYTVSSVVKDWILNLSSSDRPSAWTTDNIIVQ